MKLSRIYSNQPTLFEPVAFRDGLNVVIAEIREPENREKDTHNLGKTTLSRLIDFCLLKPRDKDFFLFKHLDRFGIFVFFLEVKVDEGDFLTIRRSVENSSRISFKKHNEPLQDFVALPEVEWDHWEMPFERAKTLLDGILNLTAIAPFDYRDALGYSLRVQDDYGDIFQLDKYRGKYADWKPYLAKMLGFRTEPIQENYALEDEIKELSANAARSRAELIGALDDPDKIDGMLVVKQSQALELERQVRQYNFQFADAHITEDLVNQVEAQISELNQRRYYLSMHQRRIQDSLKEKIVFDADSAESLFAEAGVAFAGQIKKRFEDLTRFNVAIAQERTSFLSEELKRINSELGEIAKELTLLNARRAESLSILDDKQTFSKYRKISVQLVEVKTDVEMLLRQRRAAQDLQNIVAEISKKKSRRAELRVLIEENIRDQANNRYKSIRLFFNEIVKKTIDRSVVLHTRVNDNGNLEFSADILNQQGAETSEALGHTYRKLLCVAFDMAIARAYSKERFIHFLYHDGALETLDDRKKLNLIGLIRAYAAEGMQHIITLIDSDLPLLPDGSIFAFEQDEVVLLLHDQGDDGRLFKMPVW
jgi:uncharacterized protein YydD (DUF2326 family)